MPNILIAEDEAILQRNIAFILSSHGYIVHTARSGLEALDAIKKRKVDLVITDLVMPGKDGMELIGYLSEFRPDIPIIIITAYPSLDTAIEAVRKKAFDYVTKPFKMQDLLKMIERALSKRKNISLLWVKLKPFKVTEREEKILKLMIEDGLIRNEEIADKLNIKPTTVKQHFENLYAKFNVSSKTALLSSLFKLIAAV